MKTHHIATALAATGIALGVMIGCHGTPAQTARQPVLPQTVAARHAEELADPARRENAITELRSEYSRALAQAGGDRAVETLPGNEEGRVRLGPGGITDASVGSLVRTFLDNPSDVQNGQRILDLLLEMQDLRGMPAFTRALAWRREVTEGQAIRAAQAIQRMDVPPSEQSAVVTALGDALERVEGSRGLDNRMRIHFIRALGSMRNRGASVTLTRVATRIDEDQNFLINRLAAEEVGHLRDPAAVPSMIEALFLFAPHRPDMRMNDVAVMALTQIGRPSLDPLLSLLRGDNESVNRIAHGYLAAVRERNEAAADRMDARSLVVGEACFALGQLGFREALGPMYGEIQPLLEIAEGVELEEQHRHLLANAISCAVSVVQVNRQDSDNERLRIALTGIYNRVGADWPPEAPGASRAQLLFAMMHTFDPGLLDFFHEVSSDRDNLPDFRVIAMRSYSFLANRTDATRARAVISREPEGGMLSEVFDANVELLDIAEECHDNVECYVAKLEDPSPLVVRKAAFMIGRHGRGNAAALAALIEQLDHENFEVRGDVLYAIDRVATRGSAEAVAAIDRIRDAEEGRSSWNQIRELALAVRARLLARGR